MERFYRPKGFNIQDFDFVVKDDVLFAVFIKKRPSRTKQEPFKKPNRYGIILSDDGFVWKDHGDVLLPDAHGWDQSLWAGSISRQGRGFVIYYSAILNKDRHASCKIGKAYSKDLIHWKKDPDNPVLLFDAENPYYSDEPKLAFRDPFFFEHEGKKFVLFAGKDKSKPTRKQGCVGLVEETEPNKFQWRPPVYSPGKYFDGLECPALYFLQNRWYLFFGLDIENVPVPHMKYAVSDNVFGPYLEPEGNKLLSDGHYIGRVVRFRKRVLYYAWYKDVSNGKIRIRLSSPRQVMIDKNGLLSLEEI